MIKIIGPYRNSMTLVYGCEWADSDGTNCVGLARWDIMFIFNSSYINYCETLILHSMYSASFVDDDYINMAMAQVGVQ